MSKSRRIWTSSPSKPALTASLKLQVETKARNLIEAVLKPRHVKPFPEMHNFNYIIDIGSKWYRNYLYFFSTYACPGPNTLPPTFESKFARMEYLGSDKYALSFMRHTGEWVGVLDSLSLEECMEAIQNDPWFQP